MYLGVSEVIEQVFNPTSLGRFSTGKSCYHQAFLKWWMAQLKLGSWKEREEKRNLKEFNIKLKDYEETPLHKLIQRRYNI